MRASALLPFSAALLFAATAWAAGSLSPTDSTFVATVGQGGMFEVELGLLGVDKGSTPVLRDQAATEAHDHKLVGAALQQIVADAGGTLPSALDAHFSAELDRLKSLSGPAFDAAYRHDMETVHAKDGAAFAQEAAHGGNPKLRAFAADTHAIVVAHVAELKALPSPRS